VNDFQSTREEILLSVDKLCVNYAQPILRDVSFTIRDIKRPGLTQGQKVALLAPSGTGKSQLFKRISGLQAPSSGTIKIGVEQIPVQAGMVGFVPQNYLLFKHRTVEQSLMIAAGMRIKDKKDAAAAVLELVTYLGLEDKLKFYPQELSGGQQQRVSIVEQFLSSNHFLLMDEPFSGLDIMSKKAVCGTIDKVCARDELNTIIFSTHDIESAIMVADTVMILGRDHDSLGNKVPGARIQKEIDLVDRNLAWHPDIKHMPAFTETVNEIEALFPNL
jgi:ABC-type nitrate/sulfonate/bicarbonate transport system ATPase subunit